MTDVWSKDGSNVQCEALNPMKIYELMKVMIMDVVELTELPPEHARSILVHYRWNKEKAVDAYFNTDQLELYEKAGIVIPGLDINFLGKKDETCQICFCDFTEGEATTAGCGHYFCNDCWKEYLKSKIMDESEGEALHCPSEKCPQRVPSSTVMALNPQVFKKHQELCALAFAEENKYMRRCPAADCKLVIKISESEPLRCSVTCPCGHRFCFECYQYAHDPISCSRLKTWQEFPVDKLQNLVRSEEENLQNENWIRSNSKRCPKCSSPIEKNGGCNHMTCKSRSCAHEFCWVCMGVWSGHGNANSCNAFVQPGAAAASDELQTDVATKQKLERFQFHKARYDNHVGSMELEKKYRATITEKYLEFKNCQVLIEKSQMKLIKDSLNVLLRSRLLLANSYIFAFYVSDCKLWEIYLENQAILEAETENLTDYFQNTFLDEDLESIKRNLPDLNLHCRLRIDVMLDHIADGYERGAWTFSK